MAEITAALVKELREITGAGMMDCKKALNENGGDIDASVDWLRTKGIAGAAKKASRVASEGLVGIAVDGTRGAVVEVNAETDFVARNETFQEFVRTVAGLALEIGDDLDALNAAAFPGSDKTVAEQLTEMIATIGENMNIRRAQVMSVESGALASYMHGAISDGLGKIGVLVALESSADTGALESVGKQIAMHVAAANPLAVSRDDVDPELLEREKQVLAEQARESGKPEEIIEKMMEGRLRKYYEEICLLEQVFVVDGENKVEKIVADIGGDTKVSQFARFALGEGIEKEEEDYAAEVASLAGA